MNNNVFRPIFEITPAIESALDDIDRSKWLIENRLHDLDIGAWIQRDVRVRRAVGTTRIEGANLDEDAVRADMHGAALGRKHSAEENARVRPDGNRAADRGIGGDVGARVDCGLVASVFDEHG